MMKKARRDSMEASPSTSYLIGQDSKARFRYLSLLQDYQELLKETEAKRKELQKAKQAKLKLMAEVRFLQRKFKSLSENPSKETLYRLKKHSRRATTSAIHIIQSKVLPLPSKLPCKEKNRRAMELPMPSSSVPPYLNQTSLPKCEEMDELQLEWENPRKMNKKKKFSTNAGGSNDLKVSSCRDVRSNSNRGGKRKISWQDPVTLRI